MLALENITRTYGPFPHFARSAKVAATGGAGGSVLIQHLVAGEKDAPDAIWNLIHTLSVGDSVELLISNASFRLIPLGGAQFSFAGS